MDRKQLNNKLRKITDKKLFIQIYQILKTDASFKPSFNSNGIYFDLVLIDDNTLIKIDELLNLFGRPFIEYSLSEKRTNIEKLFQVNYIISENTHLLETNTDPIILGMTVLGKIRDLF